MIIEFVALVGLFAFAIAPAGWIKVAEKRASKGARRFL